MAEDNSEPSLFGWTPQPRVKGRGRPEHQATPEKAIRVISLLALGRSEKEVASAIGCSVPTMRKYYFSDPRIKAARLVVEGDLMAKLAEEAGKGNVSAIKEFMKRLDKAALAQAADRVADRGRQPAVPVVGKKEAAKQAAQGVKGKYAPRPLLN